MHSLDRVSGMSLRIPGRAVFAAAIMLSLFPAAPAQAASPVAVDVFCESLGRYRVLCERTISGGTAPFVTKWYYNGSYFAAYENKAFTSWSCTLTGPNQYQAVVTDAAGLSATDTSGVGCRSGNP
jgi:hypothetical protein